MLKKIYIILLIISCFAINQANATGNPGNCGNGSECTYFIPSSSMKYIEINYTAGEPIASVSILRNARVGINGGNLETLASDLFIHSLHLEMVSALVTAKAHLMPIQMNIAVNSNFAYVIFLGKR